ncbi:MAG TPA: hypothetical protein VMW48_05560 [Vicinamibacterales bacterium]|nr:hypothetical protein [Vicinamibacterales bacterium]
MLGEPKDWQQQRRARLAQKDPEFAVSDVQGILNVDGARVRRGELPTTFTQTAMRLAAEVARRRHAK